MADDDHVMLDMQLANYVIQMIRDRTGDNISATIMHLCLCLRLISDHNNVPPEEAFENFKQAFLGIKSMPTSNSMN